MTLEEIEQLKRVDKMLDYVTLQVQTILKEKDLLKETLLNVITAVEKERKLSGKGKQLPVITEAYSVLKSLK